MPTSVQLIALLQDSLFLTNTYISIHLVRIDERTTNIVILAGETIQVEITPSGRRIIR
ncbi:hypothetical protein [Chroococcidiopsis sp. CCMEE 29]|uniref:DUF6888 family protein n=1 Tax=Chroococcidiopsis sp. CCMEE 29 TaxID=155894 RepID=UPI002021ACC4|nr:hypothetical protein [Chroococcidiopsis sp. CCMEE 29]